MIRVVELQSSKFHLEISKETEVSVTGVNYSYPKCFFRKKYALFAASIMSNPLKPWPAFL